jgi:hypothetical protein
VLVLGFFAGFVIALVLAGWVISRRDHRRGSTERDATEMWRENVRENVRDQRAMIGGQRINPDLRWTDWGRRNHRTGK